MQYWRDLTYIFVPFLDPVRQLGVHVAGVELLQPSAIRLNILVEFWHEVLRISYPSMERVVHEPFTTVDDPTRS